MTQVELYDATLRDGMQGEGMSLTAHEKLRVAHELDQLGIDLIEAGFPASNPKELELFELLALETFEHAEIAAFGMTRRKGITAEDDEGLQTLAACFAPVCTLVGKTWDLHLEKVVKVSREENLAMIAESVAFLVGRGKRVIYDAEHFFDGYRSDPAYSLQCLRAAADAGAERVVPCDTNGSSLPHEIGIAVADVVAAIGGDKVGIHCHDDLGCGVANTLAGVLNGATQVQGTMNGVGERTGNANLVTIIGNLQTKLGHEVLTTEQLSRLTATAHFVDEILNFVPDPNQPFVGRNAFAHKGGLHVAGVRTDASTFEHMAPELVGNARALIISELAGRHTVSQKAEAAGISLDDARGAACHRPRQGDGARRVPVRGGRWLVRAAAAQGGRRVRAALPARLVARRHRAARRRERRDRSDDQDLGRRRALRADRARAMARSTPSTPRCATRSGRSTRTCATSSSSTTRSGSSTSTTAPAPPRAC